MFIIKFIQFAMQGFTTQSSDINAVMQLVATLNKQLFSYQVLWETLDTTTNETVRVDITRMFEERLDNLQYDARDGYWKTADAMSYNFSLMLHLQHADCEQAKAFFADTWGLPTATAQEVATLQAMLN